MRQRYSIAEARDNFARLVHEAESGTPVEVTRRGRPVAIVVSLRDYERLSGDGQGFTHAYQAFRQRVNDEDLHGLHGALQEVRDRSSGRQVSL